MIKQERARPLHSLGSSFPDFFPFALSIPCDPLVSFWYQDDKSRTDHCQAYYALDEHPGTTWTDYCSQSFHNWHQTQILSCPWTSEKKKSLPIWSECQVITFNMKQKHESQGKCIPDCSNLMNTRIESIWRPLFFHSQWGRRAILREHWERHLRKRYARKRKYFHAVSSVWTFIWSFHSVICS